MSTLGGSKGERNAKPKFSALDINRLYKNSRGESVEPAAQKNQVPRKHGMQSLGKVPSTRRPPANLPSLKAEVRLPGTNTTNSNSNNSQTSGSIVNNNNNNTSSTLSSSKQDNLLNSSSSAQGTLLNHHHHQNHHSSSSSGAAATGAAASSSSTQQTLTNSSSSSVTWSSVTTGHDILGAGNNNTVPPHYQSPQFQHEFPSLDGSASGNKGSSNQQPNREGNQNYHHQQHHSSSSAPHSNHQQNFRDGNTGNGNEVSLRPQTDAASWHQRNQHQKEQQMQEQLLQQTGNSKFIANDSSAINQSGDGSGRIGGGLSAGQGHQQHHHNNPAAAVPPPLRALMPSFMMRSSGDSGGSGSRSLTPPTGQQQSNGSNNNYQQRNYQQNRSASPNYLRGQGGKRPSPLGRGANSPYENEAVLQQRPIIKEEELERMNALAKSDGWALPDEIDYNKQLALSDDESPENTPTVERDRPPQFPKIKKDQEKQNGHRPSTNVDQAALERAKLRKEEEERREQERRDGARKKLQELEMKMGATTPTNVDIEDEDGLSDPSSQSRRQFAGSAGAGNRYDRERDFRPAQQANKTTFSSHFQSNLPPRFQRQQAAMQAAAAAAAQTNQTSPPGGGRSTSTAASQNTANYERDARDSGKPVPFAQQYDPRYMIHSQQNYKQQQQQQRRSGGYGRNRSDNSENDDEFSRYNRRSGGDSDHQGRGITRSISDSSSNRKISCSSNDELPRSDSRDHLPGGSWADESDIHIGRRHRDESFSSSHSKTDDMEQGHVKILQRPSQTSQSGGSQSQNKSLSESSTKNEKILEEEESDSKSFTPTQILRRSEESPKTSPENAHQDESNKTDIKDLENDKKDEKLHSGSHKESTSDSKKSEGEDSSGQNVNRNDQKRPSPRSTTGSGSRNDIRGSYSSRGGYNSYGSSNRGGGGGWGRRGGGGMRNESRGGRHYNDWSESENSEMGDDDYSGRRNDRSPKNPKKDHGSGRNMSSGGHNKEGFVPRGEPSRRGRGGGGNVSVSSSSYRRGGSNTVPSRRNDSYNSKNSFPSSSNEDSKDKSVDDSKKRDSDKKDEKKGTTPPKSSSSSSVNSSYQHTRKESTSSSKNEDLGKRDEKKDNIPQRSASSGQIKSSPGSTSTTSGTVTSGSGSAKKDDRKPSITKPPPGYNSTTKSTISPQTQQQQPQIAQKSKSTTSNSNQSTADARPSSSRSQTHYSTHFNKNFSPRLVSNPNPVQVKSPGNAASANNPQQWVSAPETSSVSVTSTSSSQMLDGSTAPVNTIIFENTNYKTTVTTLDGSKQDSSPTIDSAEALTASLTQMSLNAAEVVAATAEYEKEMKIGAFGCFDAEFPTRMASAGSATNEDKSSSLPRTSSNTSSVASSASDLNLKIASVKKVWDTTTLSPLMEQHNANEAAEQLQQQAQQMHHHQQIPQQQLQHLASHIHAYNTFEEAANAGVTVTQDTGVVDVVKQTVDVNKVKQNVQQQQLHHPSNLGLSPPPSLQQQQQQQQQQLQHQVAPATQQFYPPSQYQTAAGIPTIPSPPVLFNSSGIAPTQSGMYPFIEPRSQFSQFPTHYGTTGTGAPYNAYAMQTPQMQTAPPQAQSSDFYANLRSAYPTYRMSGTVQSFNQNQQLNNPNTVLISSSTNSLISASAKPPSTQQLGTIGSKNNVDAAIASGNYGYMNLYQQQGPPQHGGHHSQIPSSSYYSNTAGAYFSAAANSGAGTQSYGMFGGHAGSTGGSHSTNGPPPGPPQQMPNYSSQFQGNAYNTLLAPALNQFRGAGAQQQSQQGQQSNQQYIKATNQGPQNHLQDSMGRQLKSPLGADVTLNLGNKIQPQQSPPHHKNYSQSWDMNQVIQQQQSQQQQQRNAQQQQNQMNASGRSGGIGQGPQRYPAPIQRPTNYPQHPAQQNQQQRQIRHDGGNRSQGGNNGPPMNKHYYGNSGGNRVQQHPSNHIVVDQHKSQSSIPDKDGNVTTITQQEMTVKEDNSND